MQVQMHLRRVRDAEQFFFGRGSTLGKICELLGYDEAEYRSRVAAWLGERAEVFRKAEAFVDAFTIWRPAGRHRLSQKFDSGRRGPRYVKAETRQASRQT